MPLKIEPDAFYSPEEAAPILGKNLRTQAKDRSLGTSPPFVKLGKPAIYYRGSDLIARAEERTVRRGSEYRERFGSAREVA